jgi:hypothetical protein
MVLTLDSLQAAYKALEYPWNPVFNVGAVRASEQFTNEWDDLVFWALKKPEGGWDFAAYNGTTDPGFQKHGTAIPEGTATMKAGFYKGLYAFGFHQGKKDHPCLKQVKPAQYYRMKDGKQFDPTTIFSGIIGTNLHSTRDGFTPTDVDNWSKGCVVVQRWASHEKLLAAAEKSMLKSFDFALITERQLV